MNDKTERGSYYQLALIILLIVITALFGVFWMRELFPEYKVYQEAFVELEEFRASLTGTSPAPFKLGVKQILFQEEKGPEKIDRCISCHVALDIEAYGPTRIAKDINGEIIRDPNGIPVQESNPNYVFTLLKEKEPETYKRLQFTEKALIQHPLIGKETRPFEYHPINEYGCTSCHSGNGRALTVDKAHGPIFDGDYEAADEGPKPQFLERDPLHDPLFAYAYNDKPGEHLLFQTTPLLVGGLIESRCVQCHQMAEERLQGVDETIALLEKKRENHYLLQKENLAQAKQAFKTLQDLKEAIQKKGLNATKTTLLEESRDETLPLEIVKSAKGQLELIGTAENEAVILNKIEKELGAATNSLSELEAQVELTKLLIQHAKEANKGLKNAINDPSNLSGIVDEVDLLTTHFQRGRSLYVSQACFACHKITGFSRGGVGPELTEEGKSYPWFVKESIVWPQADLKTSTMPNMMLDHREVEDLMTFIMAQQGKRAAQSDIERKERIKSFETGAKLSLEKPVPFEEIHNLTAGMTTFATEGCASCHRLQGFDSEVGFAASTPKERYQDEQWFKQLIPEDVGSRELVRLLEEHQSEIDQKIQPHAQDRAILDEIEAKDPELLPAFFAPFRFALRAKGDQADWKERVNRVMKVYYQVYGLGRLIGPRLNWSGIYRSNEWLMEHFWNPSLHVANSIMPVFPFDDTKFQQLIYMLDTLSKRNRDHLRGGWEIFGFNPASAFQETCAQCHGDQRKGNGPVAPWIYPIPKNLSDPVFLRGLGRERVREAIHRGVRGGPMAPWGEARKEKGEGFSTPVYEEEEIEWLVDWLFSETPQKDLTPSPKWQYSPADVIKELNEEGTKAFLRGSFFPALFLSTWSEKDLFTTISGDPYGVEKERYYIKKEFYTPENIEEGKKLFLFHCAICHGNDADGSGVRAEVMLDAKPRMLINLDWSSSRDDLRLLRSIKYGVPGTAMIGFGDITTVWQRIQIVIYLRSLLEKSIREKEIKERLYPRTISSEIAISGTPAAPLFTLQRQKIELIATQVASKENSEALLHLFEEWVKGALPEYKRVEGKIESIPPQDNALLETEMEKFILDRIKELQQQLERSKEGFEHTREKGLEETLKGWNGLLRSLREEFSENRRLWKDQKEVLNGNG